MSLLLPVKISLVSLWKRVSVAEWLWKSGLWGSESFSKLYFRAIVIVHLNQAFIVIVWKKKIGLLWK